MLLGTGLAGLALATGGCCTLGRRSEDLHGATDVLTLPVDDTPHVADAATASARIAWELMISGDGVRTENTAMSPSSLAVTLAMLAEGATGESLQGLDEAFGLSGDDRSAAIGALRQALAGYEDLPKSIDAHDPPESPVVHQANRVVILDDFEVKQPFLDWLASYYATGATRVPPRRREGRPLHVGQRAHRRPHQEDRHRDPAQHPSHHRTRFCSRPGGVRSSHATTSPCPSPPAMAPPPTSPRSAIPSPFPTPPAQAGRPSGSPTTTCSRWTSCFRSAAPIPASWTSMPSMPASTRLRPAKPRPWMS